VTSIISLLVAITAPALSAARRQGQITTCQSRLHEVARALWAYSVANDSRVPYVESPMVNNQFGKSTVPNEAVNPYDRERWPLSLQNVLMPLYLGEDHRFWVCPAANFGWPRNTRSYDMTYRDAGANQPAGTVTAEASYQRESFGFLDGRPMIELHVRYTGDPMVDAQRYGASRGSYLRDMVLREGTKVTGPHNGGVNVINREFGVEFRDRKEMQADLALNGSGVLF